ncbi:MAG: type II secretion system GspH family protein, partial [Gammaproteobacteria bacterium]|nr:type II secretion system GspH family protein [Gammaproteobacteria bacterium]
MRTAAKKHSGGFSLLELIVVISLIGVLLVVAFWRLAGFVREAERVSVLTMEGEIRNVLVLEMAKRILNPGGPSILALASSNPMALMLETPINYLGELDNQEVPNVPQRHWFFNLDKQRLVYRSGVDFGYRKEQFHDVEYDIRIAYDDADGDGNFSPVNDRLLGVRLHRHGGHGWLQPAGRA